MQFTVLLGRILMEGVEHLESLLSCSLMERTASRCTTADGALQHAPVYKPPAKESIQM